MGRLALERPVGLSPGSPGKAPGVEGGIWLEPGSQALPYSLFGLFPRNLHREN